MQVHIKSDGTTMGTKVTGDDNQPLCHPSGERLLVTRIAFEANISNGHGPATVEMKALRPQADIEVDMINRAAMEFWKETAERNRRRIRELEAELREVNEVS